MLTPSMTADLLPLARDWRAPDFTPVRVADAVGRLLTGDRFRTAARTVADEIWAMPSQAEVVEVLVGEVAKPSSSTTCWTWIR